MTFLDVTLAPEGEKTRLTLEHTAHIDDDRWNQFGPGAVGVGWDLAIASGLSRHLETGAAVDPAQAEAWSASSEGKEFIRLSSEDWARASIAAGTPEDQARAAAQRTTAFYTGDG